jgi:hypothetical protein
MKHILYDSDGNEIGAFNTTAQDLRPFKGYYIKP